MLEEQAFYLAKTTPHPFEIDVERAEGSYIFDQDGKKYLDFIAGISVSSLGHSHPRILKAINEQANKHLHVMVYGEFKQKAQQDLGKELSSLLPKELHSYYFLNSGTEAIEAAIKLVKRASSKSKIIAFEGSYHGNTHGSLSVSHREARKSPFRPLLPDIHFIKLNDFSNLEEIDQATAAVFLETIQGDAGIRIPSREYMQALRKRCTDTNTLLVLDEIQCGMGRTGKFSAFEHYGIVPDVLCMGKALGGGLPIGALIANKELMELFSFNPKLGHITTFGGHPLVCATAAEGLRIIKEEALIETVEEKAALIKKLLIHPKIKEIRHKGLFIAVELASESMVEELVLQSLKNGLILFWFLSTPTAFRIAPPLNISTSEIEEGCEIILEILNNIA